MSVKIYNISEGLGIETMKIKMLGPDARITKAVWELYRVCKWNKNCVIGANDWKISLLKKGFKLIY